MRIADNGIVVALVLLGAFVWALFWRGFRDRLRGGRFEISQGPHGAKVETDCGRFVFDRARRKIRIQTPKGNYLLDYDDVVCLNEEHDVKGAFWQEFFLEKFNIFDFSGRYRDRMHTRTIDIKTRDGQVPFFVVAQYEVRDFLNFVVPFFHWILKGFGLYREAKDHIRKVLSQSEELFAREGLRLTPGRRVA